jgi:formate hydrogenlyase subunit 3/multisubunit Na+/H+ antiporter MnhD subunit
MHERYIAPGVVLAILVGALEPRLRKLGCGYALSYSVNLFAVLCSAYLMADISQGHWFHFWYTAARVVFCVSNLALFFWFAVGLYELFTTQPESADQRLTTSGSSPA